MTGSRWLTHRALAVGLGLTLGMVALADDPPDPPGTAATMAQLRALFEAWDKDKDGALDKQELAWAFRGPSAKPYDYDAKAKDEQPKDEKKEPAKGDKSGGDAKPDYERLPDYVFLTQLDKNSDGKVSKAEFLTWAREYAKHVKEATEVATRQQQTTLRVVETAQRLQKAKPGSAEQRRLQDDLKREKAALDHEAEQFKKLEDKLKPADKAFAGIKK